MNRQDIVASHPIMIVEDSAEDFEATRRAFQKVGFSNPIVHCQDGEDALDFLYERGRFADNPEHTKPIVILLDLNMPGTDGRTVCTGGTLSFTPCSSSRIEPACRVFKKVFMCQK